MWPWSWWEVPRVDYWQRNAPTPSSLAFIYVAVLSSKDCCQLSTKPPSLPKLSNSLARRSGRRSCRYFSFLSLFPHDFSRASLLPWMHGYTDHPINSPGGLIGEYERPLLSVTFSSGYLSLRAHISISSCLPLYWHLPLAPSLLPHRLFSMAPAWGWPGCAMTWESHPASENGRISAFPQQAVLQVPSPPQK